ncbi:hypothetical protein DS745_11950 [Anaerobacillus alkaliphilus]|uniref:histidine kinase n=1 Tax=Anaerobacillus alkaliphilus TaxID=1548597 RepID=A0A4Q0VRM7_9BACI|nr:sensor histidine kinase [Anaerobacillus alkaliphilus]RXJ00240.1 hypothetical protein DS745_11950 [Anaerobacillus alkaliphilus]
MLELIEDYLVNMSFILLPILLCQSLLTRDHTCFETKKQKVLLSIIFSVTSLLCLSFPVVLEGGILDLRLIPFIVATLYGGFRVGLIVLITSLLYRFYLGGLGFYISIVEYLIVFLLLLLIIDRYRSYTFAKKLVTSSVICLLPTLVGIPVAYYLFGIEALKVSVILIIFTQLSILCCIYIMESTLEKVRIIIELHKLEKESIVSHLAASVSHEVRNPLTVTKGFLQLLKEKNKNSEDHQYFTMALDELKNAELILSDFLTFAKPAIESITTVDMYEEIQRSINVIRPLANLSNVNIHFEGKPLKFKGDKQKIHQAYVNILKNCIEAMPKGGNLKISLQDNEKYLEIIIKDTGIGMSQSQLLRLGEPFFSTKETGTGLGMMVAFSIIKSMGGTLEVSSVLNGGTTFKISFLMVTDLTKAH